MINLVTLIDQTFFYFIIWIKIINTSFFIICNIKSSWLAFILSPTNLQPIALPSSHVSAISLMSTWSIYRSLLCLVGLPIDKTWPSRNSKILLNNWRIVLRVLYMKKPTSLFGATRIFLKRLVARRTVS